MACLQPLENGESSYHGNCLTTFWQDETPVIKLDYKLSEIEELAKRNIAQRIAVTGIQPKLSLGILKEGNHSRLTIVGALEGRYILKPPYSLYPQLPEVESLCMLMTMACGISTVPFLLVPLKDGELCYLTKRIDRNSRDEKYAMEDACQFTNRLTEHKYRGSYEQIAKSILTYTQNPLLDVVRFYEQVIVSFLIGNNDMHLKNFSLISFEGKSYTLAPAYDMVAAQLLLPADREDLALTLNGKKRKLTRADFEHAMGKAQIPGKAIENLWVRIENGMITWEKLIESSFLTDKLKQDFSTLIYDKAEQLELNL